MSGIGYLLGCCYDRELASRLGDFSEPLNRSFEELSVKPQQLIAEVQVSAIAPKALVINSKGYIIAKPRRIIVPRG